MWERWKERNIRIFKDQKLSHLEIWKGILQNVRESILVEKWHSDDWKVNPQEARILSTLNLSQQMLAPSYWNLNFPLRQSPSCFS